MDEHNTSLLREQALAAKQASQKLYGDGGAARGSSSQNVDEPRDHDQHIIASRGSNEKRNETRLRKQPDSQGAARLFGGALGGAARSSRTERQSSGAKPEPCIVDSSSKPKRADESREGMRICSTRDGQTLSSNGNNTNVTSEDTTVTPPIQSKMDRYFEKSYDPRTDLTGVLPIPTSGLVPDVGWDNMLAVLKEKGRKKRVQDDEQDVDDHGKWDRSLEKPPRERRSRSPRRSTSPKRPSAKYTDHDIETGSKKADRRSRSKHHHYSESESESERDKRETSDRRPRRSSTHKRSKYRDRSRDDKRGDPDDDDMRDRVSRRKSSSSRPSRRHRHRHGSYTTSDSEDSEAYERRKRRRRKEKERQRVQEEQELKLKHGGYVYAKQGATRDWDKGK